VTGEPLFSVSEITTFHQTYDGDLRVYREAGAQGIGVWEFKLPDGQDKESVAKLRDSGLTATTCIPGTLSIYPVPFPGPQDPEERTQGLCAAIERFAAFEPEVILCLTGHPGDTPAAEARRTVVDGLRRAARVAGEHGLRLGLEPLHRDVYGTWTMVTTIPETLDLIDEVGEPNVGVLFDVYHLWDTDDVLEHTRRNARRFGPSVHICDWREETRNDFDRALPGEGIIDLPALFGALEDGGFDGWYDLEIFSDDGSFTDQDFEDSFWKQDPLEVVQRAKAGFLKAWEARKTAG
jgi:sugar phosphate isomerase/epimerase